MAAKILLCKHLSQRQVFLATLINCCNYFDRMLDSLMQIFFFSPFSLHEGEVNQFFLLSSSDFPCQFILYFQFDQQSIQYVIMQGYVILAQALASQNIKQCYGIVGVPVIQLGFAIQAHGVNYFGFRNEQQASYSAGYTGYLTGIPGVCLCVSGPGHTNAISGVANAWANCWPMLLISGSNDLNQTSRQAFQEIDQVYFVKPYTKYSVRITDARDIPYHVQKAVRASITGRPGPVFLDLPGDVLTATVDSPLEFPLFVPPSKFGPDLSEVQKAISLIKAHKRPLIIVGKGCSYGRAEKQVRQLVQLTGAPFLPTPMGKGVVPDSHPLNISAARSTALKQADLIILLGARLNWILHFGLPPRFSKEVKLIQADICAQEMGHNVEAQARLIGQLQISVAQLNKRIKGKVDCGEWVAKLNKIVSKNKQLNEELMAEKVVPMTYYSSYSVIKKYIPKDTILIGEGANTMDIGRTVFEHEQPRRKLDAATFGTMGIGLPAVISARSTHPELWAVSVMGDSAFGFSGMECETLTRYKMGAVIFIINNNGIYSGTEELAGEPSTYGVTHLNPETKYENLAHAFGGKGFQAKDQAGLAKICEHIFGSAENKNKLFIVNVRIQPSSSKKPQENSWLTRSSNLPKL